MLTQSSAALATRQRRRLRWLPAAATLALGCAAAHAAPAEDHPSPASTHTAAAQAARAELLRQTQAATRPGAPHNGAHVARQAVHPSQLPLRRQDDSLPNRQRIGEPTSAAPTTTLPPARAAAIKAAVKIQAAGSTRLLAATNAAPVACTGQDFVGRNGQNLIGFIDAADLRGCMYSLYTGSVAQYRTVFSDANIITVSNELKARALNYPGDDSNHAMNLLSFLRTAGYWNFMSTQGDAANGIPAGSRAMMNAARGALVQLTVSPNFYNKTESNAYFASEVFKTTPSGFAAAFAPSARRWLDQTDPATVGIGYWTGETIMGAMNVLFNGNFQADYRAAVQNDPSYAQSLNAFLTRNLGLIGGGNSYHLSNAMGELIRFVQYPAIGSQVRALGVGQMPNFPISSDNTIDAWMRAAAVVDQYDAANCNAYGTCNGYAQVAQLKLPIRYACGTQYTIRAQAMTAQQLADTCTSVTNEAQYFFGLMGTDAAHPVANDNNTTLELVVFDNYGQYSRFSGYLFGNGTNNGGIFLEGDPAAPGNQARFLAFRADWLASFEIWNLNHEFTHYLDARYDMWGKFSDYPLYPNTNGIANPSVWWIEGLAEYVSYSYRRAYYPDATSRAQTAPLALSDVTGNTYDSGQPRVYNWGYLAVRYMLERQPAQDHAFVPMMRVGNYTGYSAQISAIGSTLDADFGNWLNQCVAGGDTTSSTCASLRAGTLPLVPASAIGNCNLGYTNQLANGCARTLTPGGQLQFAIPSSSWGQVIFKLSQVNGAVDLYAQADGWAGPSSYVGTASSTGQDVSVTVPTGTTGWTYVTAVPRAGFVSATLRGMFSNLPIAAAADWTAAPACTDPYAPALNASTACVRKAQASSGAPLWFSVPVPAGKTAITVRTGLGSGNADLYVQANAWPSTSSFGCSSTGSGNTESCTLTGLQPGSYVYVMVNAASPFSGLSIAASAN
ncbi:M9 family metallopeptidase [Roseateles saccharophilus]|uniref:microbial collagenase n=1 Tax=Roseateles saccharophilus TaxID=304 RepID=A0A4R3VD68_ROSSA|nr:M9 family metallopeptidase [Roseateles saccharophilus]MDG0832999.1 hypothetical protein [Roseateles saccharophilus]TCV02091.1 collagenase [Roseateles saccharophilus]